MSRVRVPQLRAARHRFEHGWPGRFERWFSDVVGGAPSIPAQLEAKGDNEP